MLEGFPGMGLVSTITIEFLIEHLGAEQIGKIMIQENSPLVAIHHGKVIDPLGIFYVKKYNLIILHALTSVKGVEWQLVDKILELNKLLKVKELISIEGVVTQEPLGKSKTYFLTNHKKSRFVGKGIPPLDEGVVVGVTGALLLQAKTNLTCLFAETHLQFPDSRAAAEIIKTLDALFGFSINYKPLLKKAEEFETKVKTLLEKNKQAVEMQENKESLNYMG